MEKIPDLYKPEELYAYVKAEAEKNGLEQTLLALPCMKKLHDGQYRDGGKGKPYIVHPLMMAKHALCLGVFDDGLLAAILLHDVIEDCGVTREDLPVSEEAREIVSLVSYRKPMVDGEGKEEAETKAKAEYFYHISQNPKACLVKLLDRCNNVSTMSGSFSEEKMKKYIKETEEYILPLAGKLMEACSEYANAAFAAQYQIVSILKSIRRFI